MKTSFSFNLRTITKFTIFSSSHFLIKSVYNCKKNLSPSQIALLVIGHFYLIKNPLNQSLASCSLSAKYASCSLSVVGHHRHHRRRPSIAGHHRRLLSVAGHCHRQPPSPPPSVTSHYRYHRQLLVTGHHYYRR